MREEIHINELTDWRTDKPFLKMHQKRCSEETRAIQIGRNGVLEKNFVFSQNIWKLFPFFPPKNPLFQKLCYWETENTKLFVKFVFGPKTLSPPKVLVWIKTVGLKSSWPTNKSDSEAEKFVNFDRLIWLIR